MLDEGFPPGLASVNTIDLDPTCRTERLITHGFDTPPRVGDKLLYSDGHIKRTRERERLSFCFIPFNGANKMNVFNVYVRIHTHGTDDTSDVEEERVVCSHVDPEK